MAVDSRAVVGGFALLALLGCRDEFAGVPIAGFSAPSLSLTVGEEAVITGSCRGGGRELRGRPMELMVLDPHIADGSRLGDALRVRAIAPGQGRVLVNCEPGSPVSEIFTGDPDPPYAFASVSVRAPPITEWELELDDDTLELLRMPTQGERRLLSLSARDASGAVVPVNGITFTSDDTAVVAVDLAGLATAKGAGTAHIIVQGHDLTDSVNVRVSAVAARGTQRDVHLLDALWTQGTQNAANAIPMIFDGRSAAVSVVAVADGAQIPERVILRLFNADSLLIHSDTAPLRLDTLGLPTHATPAAQFLISPAIVNRTRWWEVVRDVPFSGGDASAINDRFPRRGTAQLQVVSVPAIRIRLVPIRFSAHGNVTAVVDGAATDDFIWWLRTRFPFGRIEVSVGAPLVSSTSFVDLASGELGSTDVFARYLHEVDVARSASVDAADHYWVGVLPQPPGITATRWAGLAYLPADAASSSILARSLVIVGREWFGTAPSAAGRNLAHELGHNLGRWHAPCGDAVQYDFNYLPIDGFVGRWVHNVNDWADGLADTAAVLNPSGVGDIMSFCGPRAVGPYTYAGILRFRQLAGAALIAPEERARVLMVRGTLGSDGLKVLPAQIITARATAPAPLGRVLVELLGERGRVLQSSRSAVGAFGDDAAMRPFAVHLSITPAVERELRQIRVRAAGASAVYVAAP